MTQLGIIKGNPGTADNTREFIDGSTRHITETNG